MSLKKIVLEETRRALEAFKKDPTDALDAMLLAIGKMQGAAEMAPDERAPDAFAEQWKAQENEARLKALARQTELAARQKAMMEEDTEIEMRACVGGPADGDSSPVYPDDKGGKTFRVVSGGRYLLNEQRSQWDWTGEPH